MSRELAYPVVALACAVLFLAASRVGLLPSQDALFARVEGFVSSSSAVWIILIACLEYTVAINVYFPGSIVILASMTATNGEINLVIRMFTFIITGQAVGLSISYLSGLYARLRLNPDATTIGESFTQWSVATLILATFLHPHSAALTSFNLGTQRCFVRTFAGWGIVGLLIWGSFWTWACLHGLNMIIKQTPWDIAFVAYVTLWIAWVLWRHHRESKRLL